MLVAVALLAAGCGRPRKNDCDNKGALHLVLTPWGSVTHQAFPASEVSLKLVATKTVGSCVEDASEVVPAAGEPISWRLLGTPPADAVLSRAATPADMQGLAGVTVSVGTEQNVSLQVEANAAGAEPVTFSIQVGRDDRELLRLVPDLVSSVVNRRELLRVRLVRQVPGGNGPPLGGETVTATLLGGVRPSGASLEPTPSGSAALTTDSSGMAMVRFYTGDTEQLGGYGIRFSHPGAQDVTVNVVVAAQGAGGGEDCQYFTDCDDGFICDLGTCKPADAYCDGPADCPTGYACNNATRLCQLDDGDNCKDAGDCSGDEICGAAGCCIPPDGCTSQADCPAAWSCDACSGACLPPADDPAIDVRGLWFTTYHFDISDTLPGFFAGGLGPVVDFLNLVFHGQLEIDIPIIGDILEAMLDQLVADYVPDWVRTVVAVLADFIHLFENMEAEGEMLLVQTPETPVLGTSIAGEEDWTSAQFFVVSFCAGGPAEFEQDPGCGRIDVILDSTIPVDYSNNDLRVGVAIDPFGGEVLGDTLRLNGRDVEIGLEQLVNVLLDVIVAVASNGQWSDFETFLVDIIPCADFQQAIDDLACDISGGDVCSIPGVEALCVAAAVAATAALTDALGEIGVGFGVELDQRALIHDEPLGGAADRLGDPGDPSDIAESALVGTTDFLFFGGDLDEDSWWYGVRDRD
jgi:hypothetical protein